jgi:hypothetical protein
MTRPSPLRAEIELKGCRRLGQVKKGAPRLARLGFLPFTSHFTPQQQQHTETTKLQDEPTDSCTYREGGSLTA